MESGYRAGLLLGISLWNLKRFASPEDAGTSIATRDSFVVDIWQAQGRLPRDFRPKSALQFFLSNGVTEH